MNYTEPEYRQHVLDLAQELVAQEKERPDEDRLDILHELVDGSEWVIYTGRAWAVVFYSRNSDVLFEEGLQPLERISCFSDIITPAAFWALRADVLEEAPEREEEEDEAPEREEDEGTVEVRNLARALKDEPGPTD